MARTIPAKDDSSQRFTKELSKLEADILALRERFDETLASLGRAGNGGDAASAHFGHLRERINGILTSLAQEKNGLSDALRNGVDRGQQAYGDAVDTLQGISTDMSATIRARPFQAAAACLAVGALVALACRR